MKQQKSPIDNLFFSIYGYYPNKAGQAYELLVAASLKILTGQEIKYDQHLRGTYSATDYQVDGLDINDNKMIEAKDYTINNRKVGRPDLQKLQGALSDLEVNSGVFASATEYSRPAKKYADSSITNPMHKEIELYHIRPSTELDEEGRIKTIIIDLMITLPEFDNGIYEPKFTEKAISKFDENGLLNKPINLSIYEFYNEDKSVYYTLKDFSHNNQPILTNIADDISNGCWLLYNKYIKYNNEYYEIKGIEYKIPYIKTKETIEIHTEGTPKILIKKENGTIDKLLTDKQFKELLFKDGNIQ